MPPEVDPRDVAREWLRRARSDLSLARQPKPPEVVWEDLCFHAQQAAEKAIKAALVVQRVDFPKTHQIRTLLALLRGAGHAFPEDILAADDLSDYATVARYPGNLQPVTEADRRDAVALAEAVLRWAEGFIGAA